MFAHPPAKFTYMYLPKWLLPFIIICCHSYVLTAQPIITKLAKSSLGKSFKYAGNFIDAIQWKDSLGENIVIRSHSGIYQSPADRDNGTNSSALFAYRYILKNDTADLGWKMTDFIKACELDITCNFLQEGLVVTDLDNNNVAEVWLVYQKACRGDVSPADMKILMNEGKKKSVMSGVRRIQISKTEVIGGEYKFDASFKSGNTLFRQYAKKLWKQFLTTDLEAL